VTEKRYLMESTLAGEATITALGSDDQGDWIQLDRTWFHPQGGGQKADQGQVSGRDVLSVRHATAGEVRHYLKDLEGLDVGSSVNLQVAPEFRDLSARLHTAGHLIAAVAESAFPRLRGVSGHHWPGEARVEFEGDRIPPRQAFEDALLEGMGDAIMEVTPVRIVGDPFSDRKIQIGDFPPISCGGTHLENLLGFRGIEITRVRQKGGRLRVSYKD